MEVCGRSEERWVVDGKEREMNEKSKVKIKGWTTNEKNKCKETGVSGKKKRYVWLIVQMAIGIPGLIDERQKKTSPLWLRGSIKWSSSPTEAPPVVIIKLYFETSFNNFFLIFSALSGRLPRYFFMI